MHLENEVNQRVRDALARVETEQNVRVLYACESGSRAWGFASRDSDYDVRFLYVHPRDWYLSVDDRRDVVERPLTDELDVSGWELRKALRLLRKSNPPLLEWLQSPVVYRHDPAFTLRFSTLASSFYSPRRCFVHYLHMAFGNWRSYLAGREEVSLKKYLYVFRPVLACRWI
jgi:predicted nucleotidyltransferase